jgi:hypothetical protein
MASVAGLLAATAVAATATAAPVPATTSNWDLVIPQGGFERKLLNDCLLSKHEAFEEFTTSSSPASHVFEGVAVPITGSFDPVARTGSVTSNVAAFRIDNFNAHARAIVVGWLGLKASGKGAVITGRIQRTRTIFARVGPRKPLLRIKRLTIESGPFQRKGKDVPDTFVIGMDGQAKVLPALAREVTRIRCRGPHIVTSRPIRAGSPFGRVQVQLRPDAATGIGGTVEMGKLEVTGYDLDTDQDVTVTVTPTAPVVAVGTVIRWDLPADLRTPLLCEASYNCTPAVGTQNALGGGFVLSNGNRSATLANLALAVQDFNGSPEPVITGTLDGAPIRLFNSTGTSSEFDERVGAALGVADLRSRGGNIATHFAKTALP